MHRVRVGSTWKFGVFRMVLAMGRIRRMGPMGGGSVRGVVRMAIFQRLDLVTLGVIRTACCVIYGRSQCRIAKFLRLVAVRSTWKLGNFVFFVVYSGEATRGWGG